MGRRTHNRRIAIDDGWGYRCSRCDTYKSETEFHSDNSKPPFYLAYTCKDCRRLHKDSEPMLSDKEKEKGLEILSKLGYDTNGNVSEQFKEKIKNKYGKHI